RRRLVLLGYPGNRQLDPPESQFNVGRRIRCICFGCDQTQSMIPMFESVSDGTKTVALIISNRFEKPGITFFTEYTQEVLFIRRGRLRVDFYDETKQYLSSRILEAGDVILLIQGGHGFEVLEDLEMFEVKQGPYVGEVDKTRFDAVLPKELKFE